MANPVVPTTIFTYQNIKGNVKTLNIRNHIMNDDPEYDRVVKLYEDLDDERLELKMKPSYREYGMFIKLGFDDNESSILSQIYSELSFHMDEDGRFDKDGKYEGGDLINDSIKIFRGRFVEYTFANCFKHLHESESKLL